MPFVQIVVLLVACLCSVGFWRVKDEMREKVDTNTKPKEDAQKLVIGLGVLLSFWIVSDNYPFFLILGMPLKMFLIPFVLKQIMIAWVTFAGLAILLIAFAFSVGWVLHKIRRYLVANL